MNIHDAWAKHYTVTLSEWKAWENVSREGRKEVERTLIIKIGAWAVSIQGKALPTHLCPRRSGEHKHRPKTSNIQPLPETMRLLDPALRLILILLSY